MFTHTTALQYMVPGDPSPEALHREEYFNEKTESSESTDVIAEPMQHRKAALLRAQVVAKIGAYFA